MSMSLSCLFKAISALFIQIQAFKFFSSHDLSRGFPCQNLHFLYPVNAKFATVNSHTVDARD